MTFEQTARAAEQAMEHADEDDSLAFNAQHAMAQQQQRASTRIVETGNATLRRLAAQDKAAAAAGATHYVQDDPTDTERAAATRRERSGRGPAASARTPVDDDEFEVPQRWLT